MRGLKPYGRSCKSSWMKHKRGAAGRIRDVYYAAPHKWQGLFGVLSALMLWAVVCTGVFIWQAQLMKEEDVRRCQIAHERLEEAEEQCSRQIREIYKDPGLLGDFWLFWNNGIESYMEKRLQEKNDVADIKSFPDYMNVYVTKHSQVYTGIYFMTARDVYFLETYPNGGGGVYSYQVSFEQYAKDCRGSGDGYPVLVNVQDISDMKINAGRVVFLTDYDYLFGDLKTPFNEYAELQYGENKRVWGDSAGAVQGAGFWPSLTVYECSMHGIRIEIGMQFMDVILKNALLFLAVTAFVAALACMMFVWLRRIAASEARFLGEFIHTIQLAKEGEFTQVKVGERKDNYAMLAAEINDMIGKLDVLIKKEYLLKISQQKTQMQAMLYQINPHFLYNTLEIIRAQANIQGNMALSDALFDLGNMYRMLSKLGDTISMRQEAGLLRHYLNILELGNPDNFYYEIDIDDETMELDTVKFWMQPLAENYFVHGYSREKEYNLFAVWGRKKENGYRIRIMDNGSGMGEEELEELNDRLNQAAGIPRENIGIQNVCQRLRYFYRDKAEFWIEKNEPKGIRVEIFIAKAWNGG